MVVEWKDGWKFTITPLLFSHMQVIELAFSGLCQVPPSGCPRAIYLLMVDCWSACTQHSTLVPLHIATCTMFIAPAVQEPQTFTETQVRPDHQLSLSVQQCSSPLEWWRHGYCFFTSPLTGGSIAGEQKTIQRFTVIIPSYHHTGRSLTHTHTLTPTIHPLTPQPSVMMKHIFFVCIYDFDKP